MKSLFKYVGIASFIIVISIIVFIGYSTYVANFLAKQSKNYISEFMQDISSDWSYNSFSKHIGEFSSTESRIYFEEEFSEILFRMRKIGEVNKCDVHDKLTGIKNFLKKEGAVEYSLDCKFEYGSSLVELEVYNLDKVWYVSTIGFRNVNYATE